MRTEVDCPSCGNVNRRARRACGRCRGKGTVWKTIPSKSRRQQPTRRRFRPPTDEQA